MSQFSELHASLSAVLEDNNLDGFIYSDDQTSEVRVRYHTETGDHLFRGFTNDWVIRTVTRFQSSIDLQLRRDRNDAFNS